MLKSSLYDYIDTCMLLIRRIRNTGAGSDAAARKADKRNKGVIFKNFVRFITC